MVILFGSRAKGIPTPAPDSDLDLAVMGGAASSVECFRALAEVFPQYPLDMVSLSDADPLLRHEIMGTGILLHGDPDLFCEYKAYAYGILWIPPISVRWRRCYSRKRWPTSTGNFMLRPEIVQRKIQLIADNLVRLVRFKGGIWASGSRRALFCFRAGKAPARQEGEFFGKLF